MTAPAAHDLGFAFMTALRANDVNPRVSWRRSRRHHASAVSCAAGAVISTPAQSSAHRRGHQRTGAVISIAK